MSGQTLSMLVHGEAGAGKSWLGDTAPAPRLILDAEGRAKYLPSQPKAHWDPTQGAPPQYDGTWETCVAFVPNYATMETVYRWLQSGQHHFRSVVVDSLMEIQKRFIDDIAPGQPLDQQDWGTLLRGLEKLVRDYRDIVNYPSNPIDCVVFTVGSKANKAGKMKPLLQGAMGDTVAYYVDAVGYMYNTSTPEGIQRAMLVQDSPTAIAKDGTNKLGGPSIRDPHLGVLFEQLNGHEVASTVPVGQAVPSQMIQATPATPA